MLQRGAPAASIATALIMVAAHLVVAQRMGGGRGTASAFLGVVGK